MLLALVVAVDDLQEEAGQRDQLTVRGGEEALQQEVASLVEQDQDGQRVLDLEQTQRGSQLLQSDPCRTGEGLNRAGHDPLWTCGPVLLLSAERFNREIHLSQRGLLHLNLCHSGRSQKPLFTSSTRSRKELDLSAGLGSAGDAAESSKPTAIPSSPSPEAAGRPGAGTAAASPSEGPGRSSPSQSRSRSGGAAAACGTASTAGLSNTEEP